MQTAKKEHITLAVDPLVYGEMDSQWQNAGKLQRQLLDMGALKGKGAEFYGPYKQYIFDGKTLVVAPHKMYGPESNDLIYQLRSRNIDTVILSGMVANLCVDSHMRALMENGFKVYVVKDAVAAPGDAAYQAALVNYDMIANGVITTVQAMQMMSH
jgi:nicotinamidase-related amidase